MLLKINLKTIIFFSFGSDSSVGIATGSAAGLDSQQEQNIFFFSTASRPTLAPA
jgi:hypothetical protein